MTYILYGLAGLTLLRAYYLAHRANKYIEATARALHVHLTTGVDLRDSEHDEVKKLVRSAISSAALEGASDFTKRIVKPDNGGAA